MGEEGPEIVGKLPAREYSALLFVVFCESCEGPPVVPLPTVSRVLEAD